jgi:hypothetical protein
VATNGIATGIDPLVLVPLFKEVFPIMFNKIDYFKAITEDTVDALLTDLKTPGIKPDAEINVNTELSTVVATKSPAFPIYKPPAVNGNAIG